MNGSVAGPLDWSDLQALLAVARAGSFSAAARQGGLSQPTLTRRIAGLEARLGAVLMTRGAAGIRLTDAGRDAVARAEAMEDAAARLALSAAGRARGVSGVVRVTASRMVATYLLPPLIAELLDAEPALEIELVASDETSNLLRREADIALRMYRPTQSDLIARKTADLEIGLFAAPAYLARHGTPETAGDLSRHRLLDYDRSSLVRDGFAAAGFVLPREAFRLRTDDQVAVAARDGRVRRVLPDARIAPLPLWLAAHAELRGSDRVRRVFDHLAEGVGRLARGASR